MAVLTYAMELHPLCGFLGVPSLKCGLVFGEGPAAAVEATS